MDNLKQQIEQALKPLVGQEVSAPKSILIPMIRKVMPSIIAQDIVGVQPMGKQLTYEVLTRGWEKSQMPGHKIIMTNVEISHWIEQQPVHLWKYLDLEDKGASYRVNTYFHVSDELFTWLAMRWS